MKGVAGLAGVVGLKLVALWLLVVLQSPVTTSQVLLLVSGSADWPVGLLLLVVGAKRLAAGVVDFLHPVSAVGLALNTLKANVQCQLHGTSRTRVGAVLVELLLGGLCWQ